MVLGEEFIDDKSTLSLSSLFLSFLLSLSSLYACQPRSVRLKKEEEAEAREDGRTQTLTLLSDLFFLLSALC